MNSIATAAGLAVAGLALVAPSASGATAAPRAHEATLAKPHIAVYSAKNRCGAYHDYRTNYLTVHFRAWGLTKGNQYLMQAEWPHEVDGDPGLFDFKASGSSFVARAAQVSPPYGSDWIPRGSFKATFTVYNMGRPGSSAHNPPMSNHVVVPIAKC
jgi:hypothetical protein